MELHYRTRDVVAGTPFWNLSAARTPAWQLRLAATVLAAASVWREVGPLAALVTVAAVPVLLAILYFRGMKLEVVADADGVRAVNWLTTRRWTWAEISSVEYVATPVVRLRKGRVRLRNGRACFLSAVVGTATGQREQDSNARAFVDELGRMLEAASAHRT